MSEPSWEIERAQSSSELEPQWEKIKRLAAEGWELVGFNSENTAYFKRQVQVPMRPMPPQELKPFLCWAPAAGDLALFDTFPEADKYASEYGDENGARYIFRFEAAYVPAQELRQKSGD